MAELRKTQFWGSVTKIVTIILGVLQTVIILHILTPAQYGIIGIVTAIASLVGVSQNVGVTDATIREIAMTEDVRHRAHIFWVSLWFRMFFTLPISILLILFAKFIAIQVYNIPQIEIYIYIMGLVLVLQGVQGVLGGVFSGLRSFNLLYAFQIATAVINTVLFSFLTFKFGILGFFVAMALSTMIFIVLLAVFLKKVIGGKLEHPKKDDFVTVWKDIFHTGFWTYIARIFSVGWQQAPMLVLGKIAGPDVVGLYNVALSFGSKLTVFAAAIGEVNLAFLSNTFGKAKEKFGDMAGNTLADIGGVLFIFAGVMALTSDFLLKIFAGESYSNAVSVTILVCWAYAFFAFLDIATNTVFVSSRKSQFRAVSFAVLFVSTIVVIFGLKENPLMAAGWGVFIGALFAVSSSIVFSKWKTKVSMVTTKLFFAGLPATGMFFVSIYYPPAIFRIFAILFFVPLVAWIVWGSFFKNFGIMKTKENV